MSDNLKKILIISSYAPPAIGGPQNMYNLLRDFPNDTYCILTSYYNIDNFSAKEGWWLSGEYFFYDKPKATKEDRQKDTNEHQKNLGTFFQKFKFIVKRSSFIRTLAGFPIIATQILAIIEEGKKNIKKENIDILVGFSDYGPALIGTFLLHKITKKPYHIFMFDLYRGNFLPFPGGLLARYFEKAIFRNAEKIIVTNDGTKKFYEKRYGENITEKIVIIYNSIFPENYNNDQNIDNSKKGSDENGRTILFTGRIYWPQIGALKNLISAVESMRENIKIKIYSPSPRDYLDKIGIKESEKVVLDVATPQEIPGIQKKADILFLPLSWNTKSQAIIDTATPGKLTDYLMSGKPMLIHAPATSYIIQYAKENNFARCVENESITDLQDAITQLLSDSEYTDKQIANAQTTFWKNHDANKNALIFKSLYLQ